MTQEQIKNIVGDKSMHIIKELYKLHLQDKLELLRNIERGKWGIGNVTLLDEYQKIVEELKNL